jgi:hypothetical protein
VGDLRASVEPTANVALLSDGAERRLQLGLTMTDYGDQYQGGWETADPVGAARKQLNSDPASKSLWKSVLNGAVSNAATMVIGGSGPTRVTPQDEAAWRHANPNARAGEMPTVQIEFDVDSGWKRTIGTTPPMGESLLNVFSLGTVPVGKSLGTFWGGVTTASDDNLSIGIRSQAAYDAGSNWLSVPAAALMTGAPGLRFGEGSATAKVPVGRPGEFSIVDWSGYPNVPKPQGPFRLIEGAEYDAARSAANVSNNKIRQDQGLVGKPVDIHETQPVKFGGSPTDPANKLILPRDIHRQQVTPWWNQLQRDLTKP